MRNRISTQLLVMEIPRPSTCCHLPSGKKRSLTPRKVRTLSFERDSDKIVDEDLDELDFQSESDSAESKEETESEEINW